MKLIKDNVVKEVPANIVPDYLAMGWKDIKEVEKPKEVKPSATKSKFISPRKEEE